MHRGKHIFSRAWSLQAWMNTQEILEHVHGMQMIRKSRWNHAPRICSIQDQLRAEGNIQEQKEETQTSEKMRNLRINKVSLEYLSDRFISKQDSRRRDGFCSIDKTENRFNHPANGWMEVSQTRRQYTHGIEPHTESERGKETSWIYLCQPQRSSPLPDIWRLIEVAATRENGGWQGNRLREYRVT